MWGNGLPNSVPCGWPSLIVIRRPSLCLRITEDSDGIASRNIVACVYHRSNPSLVLYKATTLETSSPVTLRPMSREPLNDHWYTSPDYLPRRSSLSSHNEDIFSQQVHPLAQYCWSSPTNNQKPPSS